MPVKVKICGITDVDGVAAATVTGGEQRAIIVDVDPYRLQAHHMSLAEVLRRIQQENLNLPAGIAKQGKTEYTIRSLGWFTSPEQIAAVPLGAPNGQLVFLALKVPAFLAQSRSHL